MKIKILLGIFLISLVLISGCGQQQITGNVVKEPTCNSPYFEYKIGECCLDSNNNQVCDDDEIKEKIQPINSVYEAISKLSGREDIKEDWERYARDKNCGSRYLNIDDAVYFVARVSAKDRLIECSRQNNYWTMIKIYRDKSVVDLLETCDKSLINNYLKILKGFDIPLSQLGKIDETCLDCDEFYFITFGCVDADANIDKPAYEQEGSSGVYIYRPYSTYAFAVVDVKTGKVYW